MTFFLFSKLIIINAIVKIIDESRKDGSLRLRRVKLDDIEFSLCFDFDFCCLYLCNTYFFRDFAYYYVPRAVHEKDKISLKTQNTKTLIFQTYSKLTQDAAEEGKTKASLQSILSFLSIVILQVCLQYIYCYKIMPHLH